MSLQKIFQKDKHIVIGVIHLPALLGYAEFPGFDVAIDNALQDLHAFEDSGVDGIIFENNYDLPHKIFVDPPIISALTFIGAIIKTATRLPIGISVLWNDYRTALSIAKILNLDFIRIPVFVDDVQTEYGNVYGNPADVLAFRKSIHAEHVALFTDIHVKHATLLSQHTLLESADLAISNGSDALILTGKWTGNAPKIDELEQLRQHIGDFPVLIGSGLDENNVSQLFAFANGGIVSTSLKTETQKFHETNIKSYEERIDGEKVKILMQKIQ